jgi:RNA polymerase sigma-70 factor (family 1)
MSLHQHTDHALVLLWQEGEEAAFDTLYKRYFVPILELLVRKTGSPEVARELAQETFLSVYLAKERIQLVDNLKAYIFTIARNKVFSFYRHELVKQKFEQKLLKEGPALAGNNITDWIDSRELQRLIQQTVNEMPPKCRQVFKLSREQRLSQKDIAKHLNISENTVEQHIRKALFILRKAIDDHNHYGGIALSIFFMYIYPGC